MDELEKRLRGAYDAARAEAPQSGTQVYTAVRAAARRRRTMRASLTAAVAVVALGVVGMGAYGITTMNRAEPAQPVIAPGPTASASAEPTSEPAPSSTASESEAPAVDPRFDDSPDGIAEDALPALAADRNGVHEGIEYPEAHVMETWVWDAVGDGWALDVASMVQYPQINGGELAPAVLYLVSPEEVWFEVAPLPERAWNGARVTTWREQDGVATVMWQGRDADGAPNSRMQAAQYTLSSRLLDDLRMSVYGEIAHSVHFVMANEHGHELWRAESDEGFKYYRWVRGADADGWVASALVEAAPEADDASIDMGGWPAFTSTTDGDRVLLRPGGEVQDGGTSLELVTYDLAEDRVLWHAFPDHDASLELLYADFTDHVTVSATLEDQLPDQSGSGDSVDVELRLEQDGNGNPGGHQVDWSPDHPRAMYNAVWGQPSPPWADVWECGC